MGKLIPPRFESAWGGWTPAQAQSHQIRSILELSTPYDRLKWLGQLLADLERLKLLKPRIVVGPLAPSHGDQDRQEK